MSEYIFCEFSEEEIDKLHKNLSRILDISYVELCLIYEKMRQEFKIEGWHKHLVDRKVFRSTDKDFQELYDKALVIGIDVPSLFEINDKSNDKKLSLFLAKTL